MSSHEHLLAVLRAGDRAAAWKAIAEHLGGTRELFLAAVTAREYSKLGHDLQIV